MRQRVVEEFCRTNKALERVSKAKPARRTVFHVAKLKINFCLIPKIASSSLSQAILPYLRENKKPKKFSDLQAEVLALGDPFKKYLSQDQQTPIPTFLITRHPFAR